MGDFVKNLPQISFAETAETLSLICNKIDNNEAIELDLLLEDQFQDALSNVVASVDRRKAFLRELNSKIEMAKAYRDEVTKHIKRYETIKERLIEITKQVVLANPDMPFKDSFGKQLKVIDNPQPQLVLTKDILNDEYNDYPDNYFRSVVSPLEINKEEIKKDLLAGKELSFAHLEYGKQLRGMK